jgi:hypothetical protein
MVSMRFDGAPDGVGCGECGEIRLRAPVRLGSLSAMVTVRDWTRKTSKGASRCWPGLLGCFTVDAHDDLRTSFAHVGPGLQSRAEEHAACFQCAAKRFAVLVAAFRLGYPAISMILPSSIRIA